MKMLFTGFLFLSLSLPAISTETPRTHCTTDEATYFSCSTGKKVVSVCGSKNLSANAGYLQYRFGPTEKIELELPAAKNHPMKHFAYSHFLAANGNTSNTLNIKNGRFSYTVTYFEALRDDRMSEGGVTVSRDRKQIAEIHCKTTSTNEMYKLKDLGLAEVEE